MRGEEKKEKMTDPTFKARRWVVEATHSWFNRFRKLLVRYEKRNDTYLALLHLAAVIIAFRKVGIIYGYAFNGGSWSLTGNSCADILTLTNTATVNKKGYTLTVTTTNNTSCTIKN